MIFNCRYNEKRREGVKIMGKKGSSNQRADSKNPNNPAYKAAADNRSNQMNPNYDEEE